MEEYTLSIVGLLLVCLTSLGLAVNAGVSKGRAGLLAGPVSDARDDNPLYRIDRVHMNSVEALAPFAVPAILAMLVGVGATLLAVLVWLHLSLRVGHAVVYLGGGEAAQGGKLRTILFVLSGLTTLVLIFVTGWAAIS